jgi:hypothetical protein
MPLHGGLSAFTLQQERRPAAGAGHVMLLDMLTSDAFGVHKQMDVVASHFMFSTLCSCCRVVPIVYAAGSFKHCCHSGVVVERWCSPGAVC